MPASLAAAQKLGKDRGFNPSAWSVLSSKAKLSPKMLVRTSAAAADCDAVAAGVFGEWRRVDHGLELGVDHPADVGDRPHRVVDEFRLPAADEGVGLGDAESGKDIDALLEPDLVPVEDLHRDREPVPRRRHRKHRVVRPEARDRALLGGQVLPGLVDFLGLLVEIRRRILAVGGRRRHLAVEVRRHGEGAVLAPRRAGAAPAAARSRWSAPNAPVPE